MEFAREEGVQGCADPVRLEEGVVVAREGADHRSLALGAVLTGAVVLPNDCDRDDGLVRLFWVGVFEGAWFCPVEREAVIRDASAGAWLFFGKDWDGRPRYTGWLTPGTVDFNWFCLAWEVGPRFAARLVD